MILWTAFLIFIALEFNDVIVASFYNNVISSSERGLVKDYMYRTWASNNMGVYLKKSNTGNDSDYVFINPVKMSKLTIEEIFKSMSIQNNELSEKIILLSSDSLNSNLNNVEKEALSFFKNNSGEEQNFNAAYLELFPDVQRRPNRPAPFNMIDSVSENNQYQDIKESGQAALSFRDQGTFIKITEEDGEKFLKIIKPVRVDNSCMNCHKGRNYSEGDLLAITSYSSSMKRTDDEIQNIKNLVYAIGSLFWLIGTIIIEFGYRRIKHYTGTLENMNEEIEDSRQKLSELNANKDKYFSILAHDLKNAFHALLSYSDFMISDYDELQGVEIKEGIEHCNSSSKKVYNLLEDLLTWNRMQTGTMEYNPKDFNVYGIVQDSLELLHGRAELKNIRLVNELKENASIYADPEMFKAIIRNLISNAIKFTDHDGKVSVVCEENPNNHVYTVIDNGVGMEQSDVDRLFKLDNSFSKKGTDKESGTGLGLIICKDMVQKHGGDIWVESEVGKGSKFYFSIPKIEG